MKKYNLHQKLNKLFIPFLFILAFQHAFSQCIHTDTWGSSSVPTDGTPTSNTLVWAGDYTLFTNIQTGLNYTFSSSTSTDWLVVTNESNIFLAQGTSPVVWTATYTGSVRVHVSTNSSCGEEIASRTITASVIPTVDYHATWISMNYGSNTWCPGETRDVDVTVRNDGTEPWTNPAIRIGYKWNENPWFDSHGNLYFDNTINPGETTTKTFSITAPSSIGTENLSFNIVREGICWFPGCNPINSIFTSPQLTIQHDITLAPDRIFCASMAVDMFAESCGGTIQWYDSPTACAPIAQGTDYTTPVLDETTTYYVDVTSPTVTGSGSYVSPLPQNSPSAFYGRAGQMFDVTAETGKTIEITGIQVRCLNSGSQTVNIYYRPESHLGSNYHTNPAGTGWIPVGTATINFTANDQLSPIITLTTPFTIPSGCTYSIYTQLYTGYRGTYTGSESNGDITVHAGWGAADSNIPFVMDSGWGRGFRGNLHYDVYAVSTPRVAVTAIDDCPTYLPIELLSFDAVLNGNHVDLTWSTATERENDYFTIERSADGQNWEFVCQQSGAGYSSHVLNYADIDYTPLNGVSYYRLKQTDYNGEFSYSDIRTINKTSNSLTVFPNPSTGIITISGLEQHDNLVITDISGKILYENTQEKEAMMQYDLGTYADGVYFIKVSGEYHDQIIKVVKSH